MHTYVLYVCIYCTYSLYTVYVGLPIMQCYISSTENIKLLPAALQIASASISHDKHKFCHSRTGSVEMRELSL